MLLIRCFNQLIYENFICLGLPKIKDDQYERVMEELEMRCWEKVQAIIKKEEGLGIEYDENVICDVCRSVSSLLHTFVHKSIVMS